MIKCLQVNRSEPFYRAFKSGYEGELFRMNITCTMLNTGIGCLFFKLAGTADVTRGQEKTYKLSDTN